MKCPACKNNLQKIVASDVTLDVCNNGCGGIWFDQFELEKFDESHESAEVLFNISKNENTKVDHSQKRNCPKCNDVIMFRHFYSVKREVEVDECHGCAGFWLDYGELSKIRGQYSTEKERSKAANEYFDDIFGNELQAMKVINEEGLLKAKRIANIFRFICPSYYIPSKQKGAAF